MSQQAKSIDPRSLPGMTMGARRRKAKAEAQREVAASGDADLRVQDVYRWLCTTEYCVGVRLRPCPCAWHRLHGKCNPCDLCAGDGVVPARPRP